MSTAREASNPGLGVGRVTARPEIRSWMSEATHVDFEPDSARIQYRISNLRLREARQFFAIQL
jgi:hypothetical protein